jgi:hypothetical protein
MRKLEKMGLKLQSNELRYGNNLKIIAKHFAVMVPLII